MINSTATKILHISGDGDVEISSGLDPGAGNLGISKTGTGTLLLSANADHNGPTTVVGGTLSIHADLPASSSLDIGEHARLTGWGTIAAPTTISGCHNQALGAEGQSFTAPLTYQNSGQLVWNLAHHSLLEADSNKIVADEITIHNGACIDLNFNAQGANVDFSSPFWRESRQWDFITANRLDGFFSLRQIGVDPLGQDPQLFGTFALQRVGSSIKITWTPDSPTLAWRDFWFGEDAADPEIAGDLADPDGDGIPNLVEYALGSDPTAGNGSSSTLETADGHFRMTYELSITATDILVQPEWSSDLVEWDSTGLHIEIIAESPTHKTFRASIPQAGHRQLAMRLRITRP